MTRTLTIAVQMDPIDTIDIDADSTFVMGLEAQRRGHTLLYYQPKHLGCRDGRIEARVWPLTLERRPGAHFGLGAPEVIDLATVDVVLLRQDPPFDMAYLTTTYLLERLLPQVLVVNHPVAVRNAPEKLFPTRFPHLTPPTLISSDPDAIRAFRDEHRDIIVKPLYGNGGDGVFHLPPGDRNLTSLLEMFARRDREPVIVQRFLPEIRDGDKRILLVDGTPVGAVSRIAREGEARANFHAGGRPVAADLSPRDREICATLGPVLKAEGLVFVGIDVIGDWLTEINVTSPTGIQEINRLSGVEIERAVIDAIEARVAG